MTCLQAHTKVQARPVRRVPRLSLQHRRKVLCACTAVAPCSQNSHLQVSKSVVADTQFVADTNFCRLAQQLAVTGGLRRTSRATPSARASCWPRAAARPAPSAQRAAPRPPPPARCAAAAATAHAGCTPARTASKTFFKDTETYGQGTHRLISQVKTQLHSLRLLPHGTYKFACTMVVDGLHETKEKCFASRLMHASAGARASAPSPGRPAFWRSAPPCGTCAPGSWRLASSAGPSRRTAPGTPAP